MATLIVSYPATDGARFDRDYYVGTHIPIARAAWTAHGLESAEVLFPADASQPLAGMVLLRFTDQAALDAALASPGTAGVIGDVANFTDIVPAMFRAGD
ncbi:MAG: EthD family reductase [Alphaproteobacteria bacterium]|nr:EthD family reductase [Alphaproteobacteria bacterium]